MLCLYKINIRGLLSWTSSKLAATTRALNITDYAIPRGFGTFEVLCVETLLASGFGSASAEAVVHMTSDQILVLR